MTYAFVLENMFEVFSCTKLTQYLSYEFRFTVS